jgi:hypothetical protein
MRKELEFLRSEWREIAVGSVAVATWRFLLSAMLSAAFAN